jgi:hypothetical protein
MWGKWIRRTNVVIADEIFAAKNENTIYGKLLRTSLHRKRRIWSTRRPWLIGLSATLLSRDITDARSILALCLNWRGNYKISRRLEDTIKHELNIFAKNLRTGIRAKSSGGDQLGKYRLAKAVLERRLPNIIVRTLRPLKRTFGFWPAGHTERTLFEWAQDAPKQTSPFPGSIKPIIDHLQGALAKAPDAVDGLSLFMQLFGRTHKAQRSTYEAWTRLTESYPARKNMPNPQVRHPKLGSLAEWIKAYYDWAEASWLNSQTADAPRFKLLIYVQHLKTATDLKPRARKSTNAVGRDVRQVLRKAIISTCSKIAARNPELFDNGKLRFPSKRLKKILERHKWTIRRLQDIDRTLLLAACLNAHNGKTVGAKFQRFAATIAGTQTKPTVGLYELYRRILRMNRSLRYHVLDYVGGARVVSYERSLKRKRGKLGLTPSVYLLDPEALRIEPAEKDSFIKETLPSLAPLLRSVAIVFRGRGLYRPPDQNAMKEIGERLIDVIYESPMWRRRIRQFAQDPGKATNRLRQRTSETHNIPWEIAVQTGADVKTRNFIADRFCSPGNPFVLVLTNVCTMGIDLHSYCWDVLHYTPAWTPHEAEQKTGRIDRPRLGTALKRLSLGGNGKLQNIRVHYLIWPFTYDERILNRLNLRTQLAERLLGSKHWKDIEEMAGASVEIAASRFKPLNLNPK